MKEEEVSGMIYIYYMEISLSYLTQTHNSTIQSSSRITISITNISPPRRHQIEAIQSLDNTTTTPEFDTAVNEERRWRIL